MACKYTSLLDILKRRLQKHSDSTAYIFLQDGETETARLTYRQLNQQALMIAAVLQSKAKVGDTALLLYPPGLEFICAFFGCLYAGVIAVPVNIPKRNQKLSRLLSIVDNTETEIVLTASSILPGIKKRWEKEKKLSQLNLVITDVLAANPQEFVSQAISPNSLAFLQYTSGSTGKPKGVMVSHDNLTHNLECMKQAFKLSSKSVSVTWLPHFHDMGLIDGILQPFYTGFLSILMPPNIFIRKPLLWLQAISRYEATHSGGPNFCYNLCINKIKSEQKNTLDLSSWKSAYNGAEPVNAEVLEQFSVFFADCGFEFQCFYPCYGMAEVTLMLSGGEVNRQPIYINVDSKALQQNRIILAENNSFSRACVGCGHLWSDTKVIIVDPNTLTQTPSDRVGEIWVSSSSVAQGYWNNPEASKKNFQAYLTDTEEGPFLRTGDLGFIKDRELYVTGRLKDIIIIRGQNYYPQDIELTVQKSHPALRANSGAAFSIQEAGEERLVVVQEIERSYLRQFDSDEVLKVINKAIFQEYGLMIATLVLLKPGGIDKTSSGKIQRTACQQKFLDGSLHNVILHKSKSEQKFQLVQDREIKFSLLYFSSNEAEFKDNKYQLLLEGAKFADQNNFHAVWIPERHFHPFGGLYPEPSVLGAALAMITKNIRIRPGSVVLPLQNPVRVAENWSVIDNLSGGRVDISFAKGWNPNDFVLAPDNYTNRSQIMFDGIQTVQCLWRGESIYLANGNQEETEIKIYPLPKQSELPVWITCSGGKEKFVEAGAIGANILTALLFQTTEELASKIVLYRESREKNGFNPQSGRVTLMLHTFVGLNINFVRSQVEQPFINYLESSVDLWKNRSENLAQITEFERKKALDCAFERYFQSAALFGTPAGCLSKINKFKEIGVDEIACLIDFGVDKNTVLEGLNSLSELQELSNSSKLYKNNKVSLLNTLDSTGVKDNVVQHDENPIKENERKLKVNNSNFDRKISIEIIKKSIIQYINSLLEIDSNQINFDSDIFSLGIDSIKAIELVGNLEKDLGISIDPVSIFEYTTINKLSIYLAEISEVQFEKGLLVRCDIHQKSIKKNRKNRSLELGKNSKLKRAGLKKTKKIIGEL